jgi:Protein of unknown function DUF262
VDPNSGAGEAKLASSILEQYRISDFLTWHREKTLVPNPYFQRGAVWIVPARIFLIDTILRRLPIPKIFIRTKIDLKTKTSIREIVDGQQRLRAIIEFAEDNLLLTLRAKEFAGLKYSTLTDDLKESFLTYAIGVEQLINASNDDVLEVFSRLNSYNVVLNDPEQRHAKFQGPFKWAVHNAAKDWSTLWDKFQIVSLRRRVRMLDDSFMAELFGVLLTGVRDGGQPKILKLYEQFDAAFPQEQDARHKLNQVCEFITTQLADLLLDPSASVLSSEPHFLMMFAAVSHAMFGIPAGALAEAMPERDTRALSDLTQAKANLTKIAQIISGELEEDSLKQFFEASSSSTQRIASRRIRFPVFYRALLPDPL